MDQGAFQKGNYRDLQRPEGNMSSQLPPLDVAAENYNFKARKLKVWQV